MKKPVNNTFREMIKYRAGALCLVGILSATYLHSSTFMSKFFYDNIILGGIAAFAIDAGVVAMSIFKDDLIKDGELAWMVRIVTVLVLFASGVANMSEGFMSAYGIELTMSNLMALDALTWIQWLAGTIIFPIMAYMMCDTVGTRNLADYRKAQRQQTQSQRSTVISDKPTLRRANKKRANNKEERMALLEEYLKDYPEASLQEMADAVGVSSRSTVRDYLQQMAANKVSRNGNSNGAYG